MGRLLRIRRLIHFEYADVVINGSKEAILLLVGFDIVEFWTALYSTVTGILGYNEVEFSNINPHVEKHYWRCL